MGNSSIRNNLLLAIVVQAISLLSSFLVVLIFPKILSIESYSYWQLFLFYIAYTGFFYFGFADGLYLRYGGKEYKELDKSILGSQYQLVLIFEMVISILLIVYCTFYISDPDRCFVGISSAIYLLVGNMFAVLGLLMQAVNRIKTYSVSILIDRIIFIVLSTIFIACRWVAYRYFVVLTLIAKLISWSFLARKCKEIVTISLDINKEVKRDLLQNLLVGMKLMFANLASMLIVGIVRKAVDIHWGIEYFGACSLVLSLASFVLLFVSQVSLVLFPVLKKDTTENLSLFYSKINSVLGIMLSGITILYYPLFLVATYWLPQYVGALKYLVVLMPFCIYDGKMTMLYSTYFKILRKENSLLFINLFSMLISLSITLISIYIVNSLDAVMLGILVTIIIRSIISEFILNKLMKSESHFYSLLDLFVSGVFLLLFWKNSSVVAWGFYTMFYFVIVYSRRNQILALLRKL